MTRRLVKKPPNLNVPVMNGKGGLLPGIRPDRNTSMLDAADGFNETSHLLAEPANAKHLLKSINQYRAGQVRVKQG